MGTNVYTPENPQVASELAGLGILSRLPTFFKYAAITLATAAGGGTVLLALIPDSIIPLAYPALGPLIDLVLQVQPIYLLGAGGAAFLTGASWLIKDFWFDTESANAVRDNIRQLDQVFLPGPPS